MDNVSIEGIMYRLDIVGDENIKDDRYRVLISKTLQNMPKDEREKVISEIVFCIFNDYGKIISLPIQITKRNKQPIIVLNFALMEIELSLMLRDAFADGLIPLVTEGFI